MNILLVAEESAGIQTLKLVAESPHRLVAVMAAGREGGGASVASAAEKLGLEVWPPQLVRDPALADRLRDAGVDLLLNVHSLFIINGAVLAAPRVGSFNLHPGPLPEYAGLNVPSWAIYFGEREHGVTLHWMEPDIDAGPIAFQERFGIGEEDTGLSVSANCVRHGLPLIARLLEAAARGPEAIPAIEQDLARRRYFGREVPHDGRMVWSLPAARLAAFVRACDYLPFRSPWGHPTTRDGDRELAILRVARSSERADAEPGTIGAVVERGVKVAAGDEWLTVESVQVDGRRARASEVLEPGSRLA